MNLSNGIEYLAIPGPSVIPEKVLQAMHRSSPNIYEGELVELTDNIVPKLCQVAKTKGNVAMYISNGHGAWEAALSNTTNRGDKILVAATGRFGHGWSEIAQKNGLITTVLDFGTSSTIDLNLLETALKKDKTYKAILVTHVDTSTSVKNEIAPIRALLNEINHDALLLVDCIASLACDEFHMDDWGADVMVAACQKGLMVPPGVSFVFFNEKAKYLQNSLEMVSSYWDWRPRINPDYYYRYFGGTAPTHHLYGLNVALDMILNENIEMVWKRHEVLASAIWAAIDGWEKGGELKANIRDKNFRSNAVTSLQVQTPKGTHLRKWLQENTGLTIGIGLGMATPEDPNGDGFFRLGHMGHVNAQMIMGLIATLETAMIAVGVPHGKNAINEAASVIAKL
ncbi:MAG: pyridoxal-phosphate-dependent aminotransferase family protein [Paracoccaceae bacterium]